jgi:hypothetical protein
MPGLVCLDALRLEIMQVLRIQRLFRQKFAKPLPLRWYSTAVTFIKPATFLSEEILLSGWALLQRR